MPKEDTQFGAGKSGNPGGRPKRRAELAIKISEMDEKYRKRLDQIAMKGTNRDSILAIKLLWAYAHGNPTQPISDPNGKPIGSSITPFLYKLAGETPPDDDEDHTSASLRE